MNEIMHHIMEHLEVDLTDDVDVVHRTGSFMFESHQPIFQCTTLAS